MSKAFTKETDEQEEMDIDTPKLPDSKKYLITPNGFARMQAEHHKLKHVERPEVCNVVAWAASNGDRSENADYQYGKRRLREIDRRLGFLSQRINSAEVVDPLLVQDKTIVQFGATVTVIDEEDHRKTYSIVGMDESEIEKGRVSYLSPIGNALLKAKVGDYVTFKTPRGERELEIVEIKYIKLD